jgi:hypothetical protein
MIETKIDELIAALDRNTAALGAKQAKTVIATKASSPKVVEKDPETVAPSLGVDDVKKAVDKLLKANKRKEAIAAMDFFANAKNATDIAAQGEEVIKQFIDKADEILLGA